MYKFINVKLFYVYSIDNIVMKLTESTNKTSINFFLPLYSD